MGQGNKLLKSPPRDILPPSCPLKWCHSFPETHNQLEALSIQTPEPRGFSHSDHHR